MDHERLAAIEKVNGSELMLDGYLLKGTSWRSVVGGKEYEIERYQGDHENEYSVYEVKNGVRDGIAELFDDGMVKMRWRMKNGVRDGNYVLFEKGVVVREGRWMDVGGEEERVIDNRKNILRMLVRMNGEVVYEGEYNKSMERDGWGLEFEKGIPKRYGKWKNDELIQLKQRFVSETEMIEYGDGATCDLFSHRPVYAGGYVFSEASRQILRNGPGRVFAIWNGVCEYESEWENGREVPYRHTTLSDGWYCEHVPGESAREAATGEKPLMIGNRVLINEPSRTTELMVGNSDYNDPTVTDLRLNNLALLKRIEIGNQSFHSTTSFELVQLNALESVTVGENSVTGYDGSCTITDCPILSSIRFCDGSFSCYQSVTFENLPSLQTIHFGNSFFSTQTLHLEGMSLANLNTQTFLNYDL